MKKKSQTQTKYTILKNTLGSDSFLMMNKSLIKKLGYHATAIITHFVDILANYENMPDEFYQQQDRIKESLFITDKELSHAMHKLVDNNLISIVKKGLPSKNYYSLHTQNIVNMLSETIDESNSCPQLKKELPSTNTCVAPLTTPSSQYKQLGVVSTSISELSQIQINNIDKETIKDKKTRHLDTLKACVTPDENQDLDTWFDNIVEDNLSLDKSSQSLPEQALLDINIEDISIESTKVETKQIAKPKTIDIQPENVSLEGAIPNVYQDENGQSCYLLKMQVKEAKVTWEGQPLLSTIEFMLPVNELPNMIIDKSTASRMNEWKSRYNYTFLSRYGQIIQSASIQVKQANQDKYSKFYS